MFNFSSAVLCAIFTLLAMNYGFSEEKFPEIQKLNLNFKKDQDPFVISSADSAAIVSPPAKTVFSGSELMVEVVPKCKVDSMKITIIHSGKPADTLGTFYKPPYCKLWNYDTIPDQDQLHLQFGYVIYHPSGKRIICPPMPNRWVIDRDKKHSRKKYRAKQIINPEKITLDGNLDDWNKIPHVNIGSKGFLKMQWTNYHFFIAAQVFDSTISYADFLELHFDLDNDKKSFSDINHRSIRFGPLTRSTAFAMDLSDPKLMPNDSIGVLLNNEMVWRRNVVDNSYIIEASIPVSLLSQMGYLNPSFGFDISIMDTDKNNVSKNYISWSESAIESNRYNPTQWGTAVLNQTMFPLKLVPIFFGAVFLVTLLVLYIIILRHNYKQKKIISSVKQDYTDFFKTVLETVNGKITDPALTSQVIATELNSTPEAVTNAFIAEMECEFDHYVKFQRIQEAKKMLRSTEISLNEIAEKSGFETIERLNESFETICHTTPELFRERIIEAAREAEENDDDD